MVGAAVVVFAMLFSACFAAILWKTMGPGGPVWKVHREELARNPVPREAIVGGLLTAAAIFGALSVAFILGWLWGGSEVGVFAAVLLAAAGAIAVVGLVIKSAWVSRK